MLNMGPKITVLMAVYNSSKYLKDSVGSVLSQIYRDFEFLIINDGSTDDSSEIIESFHDDRIRIHNNPNNLGQTKSLNIGLELASGDYIARMDADDVALPQWLEAQVDYITKNPDCSVVSSYVLAIDEYDRIKKLYSFPHDRESILLRSLVASPLNHVSSLYKKNDIMENGGYNNRYITAADYDLWGKLFRNNFKITTNPKMLVAIREHVQSLSRSMGKREIGEITEIVTANIDKFVDVKFSDSEIELFCRANYDEGGLTGDEFQKAICITEKVYGNVIQTLVGTNTTKQWMRKRCQTLYLKRLFALIDSKEHATVRKLSLNAMKKFGRVSIFAVFWIGSWFGQVVLGLIPDLYSKILRWKARLQLGNQPYKRKFN